VKNNNYLVAYQNKDWKTVSVADGIIIKMFISSLIFQQIHEDKIKYVANSRITTVGAEKDINRSEKIFVNESLEECLNFVNLLFSNLEISSVDIFKFNSNDDYPHFVNWFKQKEKEALISLEK